jgi:O-antigen/teichoic acid export membrane protein
VFVLLGVSLAIQGLGVGGMLVGRIVAVLIVTVLALWFLSREIDVIRGISMLGKQSSLPWRRLLTFNIWNTGFLLLVQSLYHVDIILLQFFRGSGPTGVYKAALVIAEFLWLASTASRLVLLQSITKLWSQGEYDRISDISSLVVRYTLLLSVLLAIGIVSLAEPFVRFYYGAEYIGAVRPLVVLLPGTIGFALAQPVFSISQGKGKIRILVAVTALAATTNAGLNIVLIQRYGLVGAAAATSISYGSMFFLHVLAARRLGFDPLVDLRLLRVVGTGLGTAVVLYAVSRTVSSSLISLLVVPPVGAAVYVALAIKLGAADVSEVRNVLS